MSNGKLALVIPGTVNGTPAEIPINSPVGVQCGTGGCLNTILQWVVNLLFLAAIILSFLYLIWGGIDWITSGGDKTKLQKARMKLIYALIGLILVFMAFFVVNLVSKLLGVPLLGLSL